MCLRQNWGEDGGRGNEIRNSRKGQIIVRSIQDTADKTQNHSTSWSNSGSPLITAEWIRAKHLTQDGPMGFKELEMGLREAKLQSGCFLAKRVLEIWRLLTVAVL